jgi:hypothetical protein
MLTLIMAVGIMNKPTINGQPDAQKNAPANPQVRELRQGIYLEVGKTMLRLAYNPKGLCQSCKNFDEEAYRRDIIERKKEWSSDACKGIWVITRNTTKIACSQYQPKEDEKA